jgi:hypothetical protein
MGVDGEWKKAGRDSSTTQADSFAGAKEEEKHRLASLGMTIVCFAGYERRVRGKVKNPRFKLRTWGTRHCRYMAVRLQEKVEK